MRSAPVKFSLTARLTATLFAGLTFTGLAFTCLAFTGLALTGVARAEDAVQTCDVPAYLLTSDSPLPKFAEAVKKSQPVTILVVGSRSSTIPSAELSAYPAKLQAALKEQLPKLALNLSVELQTGKTAEQAAGTLVKLVEAKKPTLVIWQTGTVDAMRSVDPDDFRSAVGEGVVALQTAGTDVILVNLQYSPRTETMTSAPPYLDNLRVVAQEYDVPLFDRFAIMRHWSDAGDFDLFSTAHGLDMAKRVHACLGRALSKFLIEQLRESKDRTELAGLLIDVAASGENVVEREGLSVRHPARFVLVGSGNPEEGELRPQLLDRFGLSVEVRTPQDLASRVEVVKRRDAYERDGVSFTESWAKSEARVRRQIVAARARIDDVLVPDAALERAARLCMALGTDGLRGELTLVRAARAYAALQGDSAVSDAHLKAVAPPALRHRLRRNPLDDAGSSVRVDRAVSELFGS